ncbi:hypothetical protein GCM10025734_06750 [Kitasatospora paranensis]
MQRRFVTAVRRGWTSADDSQDEVILIRYQAASGAQSMRLNLCRTWQRDSTVTWFAGPTNDSCGVDHKELDSDGFTSSEVFTTRGSLVVWAIHFSAGSPDREATRALAQRQLNAVHG